MSYSFNVRASTKAAAKFAVREQFENVVVKNQECHKRDVEQACAAADAFIDLLDDPQDRDEIAVFMSGSLMGDWQGTDVVRTYGANISVAASLLRQPGY